MRRTRKGYREDWTDYQQGSWDRPIATGPATTYYRDEDVRRALIHMGGTGDETLSSHWSPTASVADVIREYVTPYRVRR